MAVFVEFEKEARDPGAEPSEAKGVSASSAFFSRTEASARGAACCASSPSSLTPRVEERVCLTGSPSELVGTRRRKVKERMKQPPRDKEALPVNSGALEDSSLEVQFVGQVYDQIADHFSNTRWVEGGCRCCWAQPLPRACWKGSLSLRPFFPSPRLCSFLSSPMAQLQTVAEGEALPGGSARRGSGG